MAGRRDATSHRESCSEAQLVISRRALRCLRTLCRPTPLLLLTCGAKRAILNPVLFRCQENRVSFVRVQSGQHFLREEDSDGSSDRGHRGLQHVSRVSSARYFMAGEPWLRSEQIRDAGERDPGGGRGRHSIIDTCSMGHRDDTPDGQLPALPQIPQLRYSGRGCIGVRCPCEAPLPPV